MKCFKPPILLNINYACLKTTGITTFIETDQTPAIHTLLTLLREMNA